MHTFHAMQCNVMLAHHFYQTCVINDTVLQVLPVFSHCWTNTLLTGIAFAGDNTECIAIAGYDCDKVQMYRLS